LTCQSQDNIKWCSVDLNSKQAKMKAKELIRQ
jgi:hypothetical protein